MMTGSKANVLKAIGQTPIIKLNSIPQKLGLASELYVKLEFMNPAAPPRAGLAVICLIRPSLQVI